MKSIKIVCFAASLAVSTAALSLSAQGTNAPVNRPDARPQAQRNPARPFEGLGPIANVLTEEQRGSMEQALQAQRPQLRELEMKIRDARRQLFETGLTSKFDEAAVRKQAAVLAGYETEMAVLRVKALSQIQPPLSPDQTERIKNAPSPGAAPGARPTDRPARPRILQDIPRDENDLPPKQ